MVKEYETKVLEITVKEIERKLKKLGAKKESSILMKRWVFQLPSNRGYLRLRTNGMTNTITYKHRTGSKISDTEEIEVNVDDFEKARQILSKLHFKNYNYQENKRTIYRINDIEFCIDSWPKIPTYLEIESSSEKKVIDGLKLLNLEGKDIGNVPAATIYKIYGINLHSFKVMKF